MDPTVPWEYFLCLDFFCPFTNDDNDLFSFSSLSLTIAALRLAPSSSIGPFPAGKKQNRARPTCGPVERRFLIKFSSIFMKILACRLAGHPVTFLAMWSLKFGCRTRTCLDSNPCVDSGFFFVFFFSLNTSSSTYFPLFQLALRPASAPDSNRRRSSISPPRNHVAFSLAKQVSFEHSISSPCLLLLREEKKNIQKNDRQMTRQKVSQHFVVDRSSARPDRDRSQRCSAATSLATASTGTVLLPSQMSQIASHAFSSDMKRRTDSRMRRKNSAQPRRGSNPGSCEF